jgi:Spy/CpxP family protein refolding chaperone
MKTLTATVFLFVLSFIPSQAGATQGSAPPSNSAASDACAPPTLVASFLNFTEPQATQFQALLGQFLPVLQSLQQQIAELQTQLDALLSRPNPNPGQIGSLVLQIHALQQQETQAIENFQNLFASLLTDQQKQKVQAVTQAAQLQPVVGAFVALKLAAAPTPLPCQQQ